MAFIEVKGYVNKPKTAGSNKKFAAFTLAERQMDRNKQPYKVYYNVADFSTETPPEESSFVTVKGYLNIREYEKDGVKNKSLDITVKELEVAPPRDGGGSKKADDPFGDLDF